MRTARIVDGPSEGGNAGAMDAQDVLIDAASRPAAAARELQSKLDPTILNAHPGGHDNSIAWLLWHIGREIDAQLADLSGEPEVWGQFADRIGLGKAGEAVGYGHTSAQAHAIRVEKAGPLLDYLDAATEALTIYVRNLSDNELGAVIDETWNPPVTRGVRLVSIIDDAAQHVGQAAYIVGALGRHGQSALS